MQRRRIHKLNAGKYQTISTEMRKKVIELVVNYSMSIKQAAHCVGIHPQTAKNFFIIYKKEGRIGKKQKRNKKRLNESFHSTSIKLDHEHLAKSKLEAPDWIFSSYVQENKENGESYQGIRLIEENELSRIPVFKDNNNAEQPVISEEPTQKVLFEPIKIKQENLEEQLQKLSQQKEPIVDNAPVRYQEFQNSQYASQLIKNLNFRAYMNQIAPIQQNNSLFGQLQQLNLPQLNFQRLFKF